MRACVGFKGQCHDIFCFWFFWWISFPPAPEYSIRTVSNFFRKFAEIFASQGAPPVSTTPVSTTTAAKLPPVSTTPVANLPPVSTTPAANFSTSFTSVVDPGGKFATGVSDTGGKFVTDVKLSTHRWQIMGTVSGCRHLKVNLKAKIYIYAYSTTQRFPNKIIKIFQFEDFCHLPPVSTAPVVHLELRISPRIFEKIRNGPIGILRDLGESDSWKKPDVENLVALSL